MRTIIYITDKLIKILTFCLVTLLFVTLFFYDDLSKIKIENNNNIIKIITK